MQPMNFGEQITQALEQTGKTDLKFATEAEISPTTLRKIKRSDRSLNINNLDKAADKLGLAVIIKIVPKSETANA